MKTLRIVLADDSTVMREALQRMFDGISGTNVVGSATNGVDALRMVRSLEPEVLILDLSMPKLGGLQVIQEVRKSNDRIRIVVFSADPGLLLQKTCLQAGADFYLNKSQVDELLTICQDLRGD